MVEEFVNKGEEGSLIVRCFGNEAIVMIDFGLIE